MTARFRHLAVTLLVAFVLPVLLASCGKTVGDTIDDATITTRVKTALLNDPDVGALRIDVITTAGVVTLSGAVKSPAEASRAVQIAQTVNGVKQVKSALQVSKSSATSTTSDLRPNAARAASRFAPRKAPSSRRE